MPKGRNNVPCSANDGVWFSHRGIVTDWPPQRSTQTNTGVMLAEPYNTQLNYPPPPPKPYTLKDSRNFKTQNSFSAHDNRNSFQDHGVYFEDGQAGRVLGKRLTATHVRQHNTDVDYVHHYIHGNNPKTTILNGEYNPVYTATYRGEPTQQPPKHRRFPKVHAEGVPGYAKLDTATTDWFKSPDVPHKTPTHVLAVAQEPFLGPNKFRYSYHGLSKCYPSYDKPEKRKNYPVWMVQGSAKSRQLEV